jgi:hypothetical protein
MSSARVLVWVRGKNQAIFSTEHQAKRILTEQVDPMDQHPFESKQGILSASAATQLLSWSADRITHP